MDAATRQELKAAWGKYFQAIMDSIMTAAKESRVLVISYKDSKEEVSLRKIEPYEIKGKGLLGYCLLRNGMRHFKIDRITKAVLTDEKFEPRYPVKISQDE